MVACRAAPLIAYLCSASRFQHVMCPNVSFFVLLQHHFIIDGLDRRHPKPYTSGSWEGWRGSGLLHGLHRFHKFHGLHRFHRFRACSHGSAGVALVRCATGGWVRYGGRKLCCARPAVAGLDVVLVVRYGVFVFGFSLEINTRTPPPKAGEGEEEATRRL